MRRVITACVLLLSVSAGAQTTEPLPARLEQIRAAANVPAAGGVTFTSSSIGITAVTGVRKSGDPTSVTTSDVWHIGSLTQSFTSTLLGRFVERGELQWTSTLGELLGVERAKKFAPVTLVQVLSHRAGIAAPGATFLYSNLDYILIGSILESKTGKSWEELVRTEVLTPLKLTSAGFGAPGAPGAITQPRGHRAQGTALVPVEPGLFADNPALLGPAGTLHMSIEDLARWGQEHLRGERGVNGLLKASTYQLIHTPPMAAADYAFGWIVQPWNGSRVIWHNGSNTMWYAVVAFDAARDRGVVLVTNGSINARGAIDAAARDLITARLTAPDQTPLPAGAVYSADRAHVAYLANGSTPAMSSAVDIHLRRVADGVDTKIATFDGVVNSLAFSTDGQHVTFSTSVVGAPPRMCTVALTGGAAVVCR